MGRLEDRAPLLRRDAAGELVRVVRRRGVERADLAGPRIERHHRADLPLEQPLGLLLEVEVERQGERPAGPGLLAPVLVEHPAAAVDHHHALALGAAQVLVVALLDPLLADQVARLVAAVGGGDLGRGDLAQVAEHVGGLRPVAVEPQVADVDLELRVLEALDLDPRDLAQGQVLGQAHRLEQRDARRLGELLSRAPPASGRARRRRRRRSRPGRASGSGRSAGRRRGRSRPAGGRPGRRSARAARGSAPCAAGCSPPGPGSRRPGRSAPTRRRRR